MSGQNSLLDDESLDGSASSGLSSNTMAQYEKLAYWVNFYSVLGFIGLGLGVLALIMLLFGASALPDNTPISGYMVPISIGFAVVLAFGAWIISLLWAYGKNLQEFITNRDMNMLEEAMNKRKTYFLVSIIITGLAILGSVASLGVL